MSSTRTSDGRRTIRWRIPTWPPSRRWVRWVFYWAPSALGAVLARNVLERRREIGLLTAVGYAPSNVRSMVLSEGLALVLGGLFIGTACAAIAILPALRDRAQSLPLGSLATLLIGVVITGAIASLVAIRLTTRTPVVQAIKSE